MPELGNADVGGEPPTRIAINHDDYKARHVGRTADERQFFLTNPFKPEFEWEPGNEFVALYLFDCAGRLIEARIDELGPRGSFDPVAAEALYDRRLRELGVVTFGRIEVAPFAVERFGCTFGLIPSPPAREGDPWTVELQPGDYMAFEEPWDSGEYST